MGLKREDLGSHLLHCEICRWEREKLTNIIFKHANEKNETKSCPDCGNCIHIHNCFNCRNLANRLVIFVKLHIYVVKFKKIFSWMR